MKTIELISGLIVFLSYPIYITRIWQKKITPNLMSWIIWVLVAWSILLSYNSAEGKGALYAAIGGTIGSTLVFFSAMFNKHEKSLNPIDITCGSIGIIALVLWYFTKENIKLVQFALYLAILADLAGVVITARFLTKNPDKDRPFLYMIFGFGYGLSFFAIDSYTLVNLSLPTIMFIAPSFIWIPLVRYRIKTKVPLKEWI